MIKEILAEKGKKILLLGNEAIVRGALEAGVAVAATYPGTPSSEIGDTFSEIAKEARIYFEYSTNEKVAVETAAGAALCGLRSIVSFKHFGLNVASDTIFPLAYLGVKAGMVIVVADDPNCWSSAQSEQDSRYFARIAHLPMLEPSDAQEAKDLTKLSFQLSEKFGIPFFIRTTTRVAHMRSIVELGEFEKFERKVKFDKNIKYRNFLPKILDVHEELHKKLKEIEKEGEKTNFVLNKDVKSKVGIIVSGVSFNYVLEALEELELKIPILKLSMTYPLSEKTVGKFISRFKEVLVVEELDPILEEEVKKIAKDFNPKLKIHGKDLLPIAGEYKPELVLRAIAKLAKKKIPKELSEEKFDATKVEKRLMQLCAGCPHRASFWSVKKAFGLDKIVAGDIGCYMIGVHPPNNILDFVSCMGASIGISHGISKTGEKPIAFIGDSTFFHAGIPALINAVYNKGNLLVIILDNKTTAMTGHQPHAGVGLTGMGEETKAIAIEDIVKACGVENVKVVNAYNLEEFIKTVKELYSSPGVSVIVSKGECRLQTVRRLARSGIKIPKFEFAEQPDEEKAKELEAFGCPAIRKRKGIFYIDKNLCWGCGTCVQIFEGIKAKVEG
jgi:indolepyruvate ferredoxin oxidoreductase alpha subunit